MMAKTLSKCLDELIEYAKLNNTPPDLLRVIKDIRKVDPHIEFRNTLRGYDQKKFDKHFKKKEPFRFDGTTLT